MKITQNKQIVFTTLAAVIFSGVLTPVYAQTVTPVTTTATITPGARAAARDAAAMTRLKARATTEITRRVTALNGLITKISAMVRLTADQKTTFTSGIQSQITSLNALETKINADTDLPTLRTDVQSIVSAYRIFALYMPQVNIMSNADRALAIVAELNQLETLLQSRGGSATLLADMTAKVSDATTQAQNAINAVVPLVPSGYPGNKSTLESARTMLVTVRTDLKAALSDVMQIRQLLKGTTNAPTPTPSP
jgi:hypothetical protein